MGTFVSIRVYSCAFVVLRQQNTLKRGTSPHITLGIAVLVEFAAACAAVSDLHSPPFQVERSADGGSRRTAGRG